MREALAAIILGFIVAFSWFPESLGEIAAKVQAGYEAEKTEINNDLSQ